MDLKTRFFQTLLLILISVQSSFSQDTIPTHIIIDSLGNEVYFLQSEKQEPISFYSPIFTPVCVDGTCYPIHINLFWDLSGNYLKYTLDETEILTKIEHLPFSDFDYGLLHRVIANSQSALADFTIYELTGETDQDVDGVTGATRPELQGSFVPDALFTSYTLWHIARKPSLLIQKYTRTELFQSNQFQSILSNQSLGGQRLALNYLLEFKSTETVTNTVKTIIDTTDNSLTALCLQLIPESELTAENTRSILRETYSNSDNAMVKSEILKQWKKLQVIPSEELLVLTSELGHQSATFKAEMALLQQSKQWPEPVYYKLLYKVETTTNMMRQEKIEKLLFSREAEFPRKFKKQL